MTVFGSWILSGNNLIARCRRDGLHGLKRKLFLAFADGPAYPSGVPEGVDPNDYAEWIRRYDFLSDAMRDGMRGRINLFACKPLVSVVMSLSHPGSAWLIEAIESVRGQIYPYWELRIFSRAPIQKDIRLLLEKYASEESRITVVFREQGEHLSDSASHFPTGQWVIFLGQGDLLAEHALFCVADAINRHPDIRMIYSDEDKIDEAGKRFSPYFKCEWNAGLLDSQNFISRLGAYNASLLHEVGDFHDYVGAGHDYDLALRCTEQLKPNQIHHIPRVLYHSRVGSGSAVRVEDDGAMGLEALDRHFKRLGVKAVAEMQDSGMYRVRYALPDNPPLVSLIIPTRNGLPHLRRCIDAILDKTTYPNYEILIIDNGSDDSVTLEYLKALVRPPKVRVVRDARPFNYSALNNAAAKLAQGEFLALLNDDIEVISPDWLSEMLSHALRPDVGAVGARLWYPDDTLQHGGVVLGIGIGGVAGHAHKHLRRGLSGYCGRASVVQELSAVTAACLVIRKAIYEEVGGLNETDLKIALNDVDFCLRVREAGYRNVWTPYAELYHHESASRGAENTLLKWLRFAREMRYMNRRWGDLLRNDPAYSPNLSLDHHDFSYAWPPRTKSLVTSIESDTR